MKLDESAIDPRAALSSAGVGEASETLDGRSTARFGALKPGVVIAASMDTKGEHVDFLRAELERRGVDVIVVDCGIRPAGHHRIEIGAAEIARFADSDIATVRGHAERAPALTQMLAGLETCVRLLFGAGLVRGFVGLGGGTNASLAARAFHALPYGVPKVLVSTAVSGDTKPFIQGTDALLVHPVVDFIGLNAPLRASLSRTAATMAAIIDIPFWSDGETGRVVGVTSSGATTSAAEAADAYFRDRNLVTYMFHARGPGGIAYEDLVAQGRVAAVLDLTTTEIADEVVGGMRSAGPGRLEAATAAGIPQVVVPGGIDLINFSGPETVPARFAHRQLVSHTPSSTLMRTSPDESEAVGAWIGKKLAVATGPVSVFVPMRGFSSYDREGAPFHDPRAAAAFVSGLESALTGHTDIRIETRDQHINDPAFVLAACESLWDSIGPRT